METIEVFAASAGVGQILTDSFEPSAFQPAHEAGPCNRMNVRFTTTGTLPDWIDWRVETSMDGGVTWKSGPATVLWSGTTTHSRTVSMRPGTSVTTIEIPRGGSVRLLARRRGGSQDTAVIAVGTFETTAPKRPHIDQEAMQPKRPAPRRDLWGSAVEASRASTGRRPQ